MPNDVFNAIAIGSTADPNTTQESYILTNHANSPGGSAYWHIQTLFYASKTGNRSQIATRYNGGTDEMYIRTCYSNTWTTWKRMLHESNHTGTNPHGTTKSDVGLGSVLNYGISTQAEAQAGTINTKYMTPLRTKEAINTLTASLTSVVTGTTIHFTASNYGLSQTINLGITHKYVAFYRDLSNNSSSFYGFYIFNGNVVGVANHGTGTFYVTTTATSITLTNQSTYDLGTWRYVAFS